MSQLSNDTTTPKATTLTSVPAPLLALADSMFHQKMHDDDNYLDEKLSEAQRQLYEELSQIIHHDTDLGADNIAVLETMLATYFNQESNKDTVTTAAPTYFNQQEV